MKKAVKRGKSKSASKRASSQVEDREDSKVSEVEDQENHESEGRAKIEKDQSPPRHDRNSRLWRRRRPPRQSSRADWPLSMPPLAR